MAEKIKLRLTVTMEYEADPEYYGTDDPVKMAAIDQTNFFEYPRSLYEQLSEDGINVKVEPV